jgi:hypothetical protein
VDRAQVRQRRRGRLDLERAFEQLARHLRPLEQHVGAAELDPAERELGGAVHHMAELHRCGLQHAAAEVELCQPVVPYPVVRPQVDGPLELGFRVGPPAAAPVRLSELEPKVGIGRSEADSSPRAAACLRPAGGEVQGGRGPPRVLRPAVQLAGAGRRPRVRAESSPHHRWRGTVRPARRLQHSGVGKAGRRPPPRPSKASAAVRSSRPRPGRAPSPPE